MEKGRNDSFAGRFLLLCSSNLLLQCLGFLYRILLSRYAGTEGLGVYRLASSVYSILHATCLSGITLACTRLVSAWKAERKEGAVYALVRWIFVLFFSLFFFVASCAWFGRDLIGSKLIGDSRIIAAFPIMLLCLFLTSIENIFKSVMVGLNRIDNAVVSELTEQIVRILAAVALLSGFATGDLGHIAVLIFCASVISEIVSAATMTLMYLRLPKPPRIKPPSGYRRDVVRTVAPITLSAFSNNMIASAGSVFLPKCLVASGLSAREAVSELGALSGVAAPIMVLPMALIASLCTVTMPEISARYSRKGDLYPFTEKVLRSVGLIGIPFTALLIPVAPVIARLFFFHPVEPSVFLWMGLSFILCYYQMVLSCMLNGSGQQSWNALTSTTGELLQLFLVWLLTPIPVLRVHGYLIAQCIAPLFVIACDLVLLCRARIVRVRIAPMLLEPITCGALLFLWTRIFFAAYTGYLDQWAGLLCTLASALLFYLVLLHLLEIDLRKYLTKPLHRNTFHPMFY